MTEAVASPLAFAHVSDGEEELAPTRFIELDDARALLVPDCSDLVPHEPEVVGGREPFARALNARECDLVNSVLHFNRGVVAARKFVAGSGDSPPGPPPPPPPPPNRLFVQRDGTGVRIRGLPMGRMSATEARELAAWLVVAAEQVSSDEGEFQRLYAAIRGEASP